MVMKTNLSYQPSGKIGISSLFWLAFLFFLVLPILAYIFAYLSWYTPILGLNILVILGFSNAIGIAVSKLVVKFGKVRNPGFVKLITFLAALAALYYAWSVWIALYTNVSDAYNFGYLSFAVAVAQTTDVLWLITNPGDLFELMDKVHETGTWSIGTKQNHEGTGMLKGGFLTIVWIIEAIMLFVFPYRKTSGKASLPYSEEFNMWLPVLKVSNLCYIDDLDMIEANQNDLDETFSLQKNKAASFSQIMIYGLPESEKYLTLINYQSFRDSKMKLSFNREIAENQVQISDELFNKIESQIKRLR
jgi:hypothetical protein